jgi:hypothetical protein
LGTSSTQVLPGTINGLPYGDPIACRFRDRLCLRAGAEWEQASQFSS